jgi:hypothetical protein
MDLAIRAQARSYEKPSTLLRKIINTRSSQEPASSAMDLAIRAQARSYEKPSTLLRKIINTRSS